MREIQYILYADTIQKPAAGVPLAKDLSRSNDRRGAGRRRQVLHPGERAAQLLVLGQRYDRSGSVRASSAQAIRVHVRGLRGEAQPAEGSRAAVHIEKAAARQGLPPADHGAVEGPVLVLSAAGCAHTTFLCNMIHMIPIKRTV